MIYECPVCAGRLYLNDSGTARCSNTSCELRGQASPRKIVAAPGVVRHEGLDMDLDRQQIIRTVESWVTEGEAEEARSRSEQEAAQERAEQERQETRRRAEQEQERQKAQRAERKRLEDQHGHSEARMLNAGGELTYGEANVAMAAGIAVFIFVGLVLDRLQRWFTEMAVPPMVPGGSPEAGEASGEGAASGTVAREEPFYVDWARGLADFLSPEWPVWLWWILAGLAGLMVWHYVCRRLSGSRRRTHALGKDEFVEVKEYSQER